MSIKGTMSKTPCVIELVDCVSYVEQLAESHGAVFTNAPNELVLGEAEAIIFGNTYRSMAINLLDGFLGQPNLALSRSALRCEIQLRIKKEIERFIPLSEFDYYHFHVQRLSPTSIWLARCQE